MASSASPHPPNWRLWHPTNGFNFQPQQQSLYPALDVARFTTEASSAREAELDTIESAQIQQSKGGLRSDFKALRQDAGATSSKTPHGQGAPTASATYPRVEPKSKVAQNGKNPSPLESSKEGIQEPRVEKSQGANPEKGVGQAETVSARTASGPTPSTNITEFQDAPFTPLEYKMSQETFETAKAAKEGSAGSYWSYSQYRGPNKDDGVLGKVRVHYCRSSQTAERALQYFVGEKLLGFDLEWSPQANKNSGIRKNVSLVQIASPSRVLLLHLALYPTQDEFVSPTLKKILEDPEVSKIGVWIKGDCTRVQNFLGITVRSQFELSHLFKQVKHSASQQPELINKKLVALGHQVQEILGLPMFKDPNVRVSDWSHALNMQQLGYSASDAYAGVQLYAILNHRRQMLDPCPDLPFHAELNKPIPVPPGLSPLPVEEALIEDDIVDEKELEAVAEAEAKVKAKSGSRTRNSSAARTAARSEGAQALDADAGITTAEQTAAESVTPGSKDPRVEAAEMWLAELRAKRKTKASPAALKAYHIWHNDVELDCVRLAKLLRSPPLQTSSAAGYILASVMTERLPYDKARMKADVLPRMPGEFARKRFFPIWQAVNSS